MKINLSIVQLSLLIIGSFWANLQASEQSGLSVMQLKVQDEHDSKAIALIAKNMVRQSLVNAVASVAHADFDTLEKAAHSLFSEAKKRKEAKQIPVVKLWIPYVPVSTGNSVTYVPCGDLVVENDPDVVSYIRISTENMRIHHARINQEVMLSENCVKPLFKDVYDTLNNALLASDDNIIMQACVGYVSIIDQQKKDLFVRAQDQFNHYQKEAKKQAKKERHKSEKVFKRVEKAQKEQLLLRNEVCLQPPVAESELLPVEKKHEPVTDQSECKMDKVEKKIDLTEKNKIIKRKNKNDTQNKKNATLLCEFMRRADQLIRSKDCLDTIEKRLNCMSNHVHIILDEVDCDALYAKSIEPMRKHLDALKKSTNRDRKFTEESARLSDASKEHLGAMGFLARTKWELLTGVTEAVKE